MKQLVGLGMLGLAAAMVGYSTGMAWWAIILMFILVAIGSLLAFIDVIDDL